MNATGFAKAVVDAIFRPSPSEPPALRVVLSNKDRALALSRAVLRDDSMMLTAPEARALAREFLNSLGLEN